MEISVEKLQSLLKETVPGWSTQRIGDLDDPENVRTPATVLDSLLHAYRDPSEYNIVSKEQLQSLDEGWAEGWEPRAFYNSIGQINAYNLSGLIAELAHDIQYKDPKYKAARGEEDKYVGGGIGGQDYEIEGALEYEAHSIIEPILRGLLTKMSTLDKETIGFGSDKYPYPALIEDIEGKYHWPIGLYQYKPLIKDEQNQSQTIRPTSSVHDVGKLY